MRGAPGDHLPVLEPQAKAGLPPVVPGAGAKRHSSKGREQAMDDAEPGGPSEAASPHDYIEIRCLWSMTDYGYISLIAAARGYGGRERGSYQDKLTGERFGRLRAEMMELHGSTWPCAEGVVRVRYDAIAALFPGVLEAEGQPDAPAERSPA